MKALHDENSLFISSRMVDQLSIYSSSLNCSDLFDQFERYCISFAAITWHYHFRELCIQTKMILLWEMLVSLYTETGWRYIHVHPCLEFSIYVEGHQDIKWRAPCNHHEPSLTIQVEPIFAARFLKLLTVEMDVFHWTSAMLSWLVWGWGNGSWV